MFLIWLLGSATVADLGLLCEQENVSLSTMDTSSLLDSLQREKAFNRPVEEPPSDEAQIQQKTGSLKAVLKNLEELWDESQYAEEFALDSFITKLS